MTFNFDNWELDVERYELRRSGAPVHVEPLVFDLLLLLVGNHERVVTKDEIVAKVWGGRIVSETTVSSCVKSARQALGDDGKQQRYIRTVHGRGFHFVGPLQIPAVIAPSPDERPVAEESVSPLLAERPSIAVLRFRLVGMPEGHFGIADALPHDLISALSRLRWLFVIARGSAFRFRTGDPDLQEVGEALGVRYCLGGTIDIFGSTITTTVELSDTRDGGVIWADRFTCALADLHEVRARIIAQVVSALEVYIPQNEARFASLSVPESLDTWSAYHLGLQHMYRFKIRENELAAALFQRCIAAEPGFARAHAGLSFTYFQNAFLRYGDNPDADIALARQHAERSVELDPLDPFANFTMGRSFWLDGDLESSLPWLDRAILISPNYAQGIYARGWTDTVSGRSADGRRNVDAAMSHSPLDPLSYAMQGTRALSYIVDGAYEEAVVWADRAARSPGAHFLIGVIAVIAHDLAGNSELADAWTTQIKQGRPDATQAHFFRSFPFEQRQLREKISTALSAHGL